MNLEQAVGNIDIVLQNAQMKRAEHELVLNDLKLLVSRAQLADKLEKELGNAKELIKVYESKKREPDEVPEVPDESQHEFLTATEEKEILEKIEAE